MDGWSVVITEVNKITLEVYRAIYHSIHRNNCQRKPQVNMPCIWLVGTRCTHFVQYHLWLYLKHICLQIIGISRAEIKRDVKERCERKEVREKIGF